MDREMPGKETGPEGMTPLRTTSPVFAGELRLSGIFTGHGRLGPLLGGEMSYSCPRGTEGEPARSGQVAYRSPKERQPGSRLRVRLKGAGHLALRAVSPAAACAGAGSWPPK